MTTIEFGQQDTSFEQGSWPEVLTRPLRAAKAAAGAMLHAVMHPNPVPLSVHPHEMRDSHPRAPGHIWEQATQQWVPTETSQELPLTD